MVVKHRELFEYTEFKEGCSRNQHQLIFACFF